MLEILVLYASKNAEVGWAQWPIWEDSSMACPPHRQAWPVPGVAELKEQHFFFHFSWQPAQCNDFSHATVFFWIILNYLILHTSSPLYKGRIVIMFCAASPPVHKSFKKFCEKGLFLSQWWSWICSGERGWEWGRKANSWRLFRSYSYTCSSKCMFVWIKISNGRQLKWHMVLYRECD